MRKIRPMAGWPQDGKPAYFEDLTRPVIRALKGAYTFRRRGYKDIPWTGPCTGSLHCCLSAEETLKASNLKYSQEDQGRNAMEEIIGLAVRLGIEQGKRMAAEEDHGNKMALVLAVGGHNETVEQLRSRLDAIANLLEG